MVWDFRVVGTYRIKVRNVLRVLSAHSCHFHLENKATLKCLHVSDMTATNAGIEKECHHEDSYLGLSFVALYSRPLLAAAVAVRMAKVTAKYGKCAVFCGGLSFYAVLLCAQEPPSDDTLQDILPREQVVPVRYRLEKATPPGKRSPLNFLGKQYFILIEAPLAVVTGSNSLAVFKYTL